MITVQFSDDEKGKRRYEICVQSIVLNNPQFGGRAIQVSEWDDVVALLRNLKAIGVAAQKVMGKQLYDLQASGGAVPIERGERKLLLDFIRQPIWQAEAIEDVREVATWLEGLADA